MTIKSKLKFKSFNVYKLNEIINNLKTQALENNLTSKIINLKTNKKKFTLLKGPHVHKKARDQFELSTYTKILLLSGNQKSIENFIILLEQDLIEDITYSVSFEKV